MAGKWKLLISGGLCRFRTIFWPAKLIFKCWYVLEVLCNRTFRSESDNLQKFQLNAFVITWVLVFRQSDEMQSELPLLLTQDTSATNFMIRDARMQKLVAAEKEPITPFISKVSFWFLLSGNANVRAGIKRKKWCSRTNRAHDDFWWQRRQRRMAYLTSVCKPRRLGLGDTSLFQGERI